jgi:ankyrin repeat protein
VRRQDLLSGSQTFSLVKMKTNLIEYAPRASIADLQQCLDSEDFSANLLDSTLLSVMQSFPSAHPSQTLHKTSMLIRHGACPHMKDEQSVTLLMKASYYGNIDLVEYLIKKGARLTDLDNENRSALIHACISHRDNTDAVNYLVD